MSLLLPQLIQSAELLGTPIIVWAWVETSPGSGLYELMPQSAASGAPSGFSRTASATSGDTEVIAAGVASALHGYILEVTGDAAFAVAAPLVITLGDIVHRIWVPASTDAPISGVLYSTGFVPLGAGGMPIAPADALNLNLSAALTRGAVNVNVQYS